MNERKFRGDELVGLTGGLGSGNSDGCLILALFAAFACCWVLLASCEPTTTVRVEIVYPKAEERK